MTNNLNPSAIVAGITKLCLTCGAQIPETRRSVALYCSQSCQDNRLSKLERAKAWNKANPDKCKANQAKWRKLNRPATYAGPGRPRKILRVSPVQGAPVPWEVLPASQA
jgi:hypothetical protein